jgi:hypothetical protein
MGHIVRLLAVYLATWWGLCYPAQAIKLITESEAALPDEIGLRGITLGPKAIVLSPPQSGGWVTSPLHMRLRFETYGGAKIDMERVIVTYRKVPAIDLTDRVRAFVRLDGVDIPDVEVPPGTHRIAIEVYDSDGRKGVSEFFLLVLPPSKLGQ